MCLTDYLKDGSVVVFKHQIRIVILIGLSIYGISFVAIVLFFYVISSNSLEKNERCFSETASKQHRMFLNALAIQVG